VTAGFTVLLAVLVSACGSSSSSSSPSQSTGTAKAGGSLTVLEASAFAGDWPAGLDPATNTNGGADQSQMNSSAALFLTVVSFNLLGDALRARWSTQ
jgi:peptide/nickel transport system substrate-binding protein